MNLLTKLQEMVGVKNVLDAAQASERSSGMWDGNQPLKVKGIVFPTSTQEVAAVMSLCNKVEQTVIPIGGFTNLTHALRATPNDLLLSLEKMNQIEEVDTDSKVAIVQGGVIIQNLQETVVEHQLLYPVDWGARGSAMVGGSIATNAGGIQVLRYGTTRAQVLGLEVVLPDGRILSSLNKMIKDNAGYNLKHLFIGSEGTLGIITKAALKLVSKPITRNTAIVALNSFKEVIKFKDFIDKKLMGTLTSFEVIWQDYYEFMTNTESPYKAPVPSTYPYYVLFEAQGNNEATDATQFRTTIETAFEQELIVDGAIAYTQSDYEWFWGIRENVEVVLSKGPIYIFDVSLPIPEMEQYCITLQEQFAQQYDDYKLYIFGHFGDGNLHLVISIKEDTFGMNRHAVEKIVYDPLTAINGSITAEHGIGMEKKAWLHICRSETEIEVMKQLKQLFDPKNILNPNKIFDI